MADHLKKAGQKSTKAQAPSDHIKKATPEQRIAFLEKANFAMSVSLAHIHDAAGSSPAPATIFGM